VAHNAHNSGFVAQNAHNDEFVANNVGLVVDNVHNGSVKL